jgi:hypothetical protein
MIEAGANKGEWSEFYAHIKLMLDKQVVKGDSNLNPDNSVVYPILAIFKPYKDGTTTKYSLNSNGFELVDSGRSIKSFDNIVISSKLNTIFYNITSGDENIEGYELSKLISLPVKNQLRTKADITMEIVDIHTQTQPILGFSIKSKLTAEATLVNASLATRFVYEIAGSLDDERIEEINDIGGKSKTRDKIKAILDKHCKLIPLRAKSDHFQHNLKHFDSQFDIILGHLLLSAYTGRKDIKSILATDSFTQLTKNLNLSSSQIESKIKEFLMAFTLGMEPVREWSGIDDINGGVLWVKKDGSIVCHHLFERKELKEYLFDNTFFESPSTTRHQYGFIYRENGKLYFDLCLQIRFY